MESLARDIVGKRLFWIVSLLFLIGNAILLSMEFYWFMLVPLFLFLLVVAFLQIDKAFYFLVLVTPFSLMYSSKMGVSFSLPAEPLAFAIMVLFWIKVVIDGKINVRIIRHPLTLIIIAHLVWMFFTSISSSLPSVSFKFFLVHFWNVSVFYLLGSHLFLKSKNIKIFNWSYLIPFAAVQIYSFVRHAQEGYSHKGSGWVMEPFYIDHGVYGASLAFCIPFMVIAVFGGKEIIKKKALLVFVIPLLILFATSLILSYTRAAWISVAAALGFYLLLRMNVKFKSILLTLLSLLLVVAIFQDSIFKELNRNKTDSGKNLENQIKSISNVRTDASNLERLNRWFSAQRMFEERPLLGWGPGTFMFHYAPYQKPHQMTPISTNMHALGGIHSEYFGPMVESGILGFIIFLLLTGMIIYYGMRAYYQCKTKEERLLLLAAFLGLVTYLIHGVLNNYLDQDKTATLFWASIAIITATEVKTASQEELPGE